ncbi:MAG: U32 family peptidase [Prevotella sp.]|nr:U32 family peptidase [Prevotella sp.]
MKTLELLAPAKNLECGIAAIDHGADAVYIGASHFGARVAAGNSIDDIRKLCEYACPFGVKVYATVNTIVFDEEIDDIRQLITDLQNVGVTAVLVQDMAVLQLLKGTTLQPHASTQTDNRTSEKVRWLRDVGFVRAVLARELSIDEIAEIHREVPDIELEVFVHGALCVSYSGLCYASQFCFGRSANRGECAQFCRMKFSLLDAEGMEVEHDRYLLSLKDMNQSNHLLELIEAGASSFKIEGRLKDVGYVKNVTAAYSQRLNEIIRRFPDKYCRSSRGECRYTFTPDLNKTFNRGYTTYFLHGRQPNIASFDTPKAMGEFVGTVKELRHDSFNVAGTTCFANGDGLCFFNEEHQLEGFRANRVVGNRIYPYRMPEGLRPGMRLYRNNDQELERLLSKSSAERRIPVRLSLRVVDDGFELSSGSINVRMTVEHQQAQKPPRENIIRQLSKMGDTIYTCEEVSIPDDFNYFIPNSVLSDMRRQLIEKLNNHDGRLLMGSQPVIKESSPVISYSYPYLYNIANHVACDFYGAKELVAYELKGGEGPIMQCRHCIRYALGYCVKHGGKRPVWREPLSLVLGDGRRFRLEFDCKNCQMNVYAS